MDNGRFPTTEEGLEALVTPPARLGATYRPGGYLVSGKVPRDPWGNAFRYRQPGLHNPAGFDLWSLGADGRPGGECVNRDVGNWVGGEPDPCATLADRLLPTAILGVAAGLLMGLPFYLARTIWSALRARSWRPLVRGRPIVALVVLVILAAVVVSLFFSDVA